MGSADLGEDHMNTKFVVAGLLSSALIAGGVGAGVAAASPEHPRGNTQATCSSLRDWAIQAGGHPGDCYWDAGKDSWEVADFDRP